jgi:chemotaxis signal transduction protein
MDNLELDFPWALFQLGQTNYAISVAHIKSFVILKALTPMPDMPKYFKGMLNMRGDIIPVIDLRKYYGMRSIAEEIDALGEMLDQRKEEHLQWINALEDSVKAQKKFTLTTDPHACAFGKWRDSYQTDDNMLNYLLRQFDKPHQKIHVAAVKVKELEQLGEYAKAFEIVTAIKNNEFQTMINLFANFITQYRQSRREIVIIVEHDNRQIGLAVDSVLAIESLPEDSQVTLPGSSRKKGSKFQIAKRAKDQTPVILIDELSFLNQINND